MHSKITNELEELGQKYVSEQDNDNIVRIPQKEEIRLCVEKLHPLKSPGPDGFPGIFYRNYWNVAKGRVIRFVQECFRLRHVPHSFNRTFIVLIPKTKQPQCFNHYRPISLCNFVYKVVSKIITERMRSIMEKIISPYQRAFIEGRWIAENTVLAQKIIKKIKNHRGKNRLMVIKVDFKKAYDRMEWKFLDRALGA